MPKVVMTERDITEAKAAGWTVKDLNDNPSGAVVRTPQHWVLLDPSGKTIHHGLNEADAWCGLLPVQRPENLSAMARIMDERARQDAKWGIQNHEAGKWSLILAEELGEVAKSQLEGDRANYLTELIQSAAVLVAWLECELRRGS